MSTTPAPDEFDTPLFTLTGDTEPASLDATPNDTILDGLPDLPALPDTDLDTPIPTVETATAATLNPGDPDTYTDPNTGRTRKRRKAKPTDPTIAALWVEYQTHPTKAARDQLVLHYAHLVKYVAGRLQQKLPSTVDGEDLASYGLFGLFDAIEKFQPARGLKFETYAVTRIRGAIIDALRDLDMVPRSVRQKVRDIEKAAAELEAEHNRTPTETEIADRLGKDIADIRTVLAQSAYSYIASLDDLLPSAADHDASSSLGDRLIDHRNPLPGETVENDEQKQDLAAAIADLPTRDRQVISLYYYENLTLNEIGTVLGVTESRVCQLHAKAMLALKTRLEAANEIPAGQTAALRDSAA